MNSGLRIGLLIASIIALVFVIISVKKKRMNIKYSIVWILWALMSLFMAIFPQVFYEFTDLIGIELPVNGVFLIMIGLLYALTFYAYMMVSKHNDEIIQLTYEVASLKKKIEELEKNNER